MPSKNTKKKIRKVSATQKPSTKKVVEPAVVEEDAKVATQSEIVETVAEKTDVVKTERPKKNAKKDKSKKENKPSKIKTKSKELVSELKKVTWPTFGMVVKKTATVLVVVIMFGIVLLGIDSLLELIYHWFIGGLN